MRKLIYANFLLDIVKGRIFSQKKPLIVGLNVTNRCNLKCRHCYGKYFNRTAREFTKEELFNLIEELNSLGTRVIYLGGGEPLIREDIGEIIDKITSMNMLAFMNTNGLLLIEKIEQLRKLEGLTISLDGDEYSNDHIRGKGTFKKVLRAIEVATAEGLRVSTNTVINTNNLDSLNALLYLAKKTGFLADFNFPYETSQDNKNDSVLNLKDEEIKMVLNRLIDYEKKGEPLVFSLSTKEYALSWPLPYSQKIMYNEPPDGFKGISCYMGRFMCLIDSDGLVYPCGQIIGRFPALNIHKVGFKKAWENLLEKRTCKACYCMCFTEFNQLFDLRPKMLFLTARRFLKKTKRKNDSYKRSEQ